MEQDKEKFSKCEICGSGIGSFSYDSPLYCGSCIAEMEKLSLSPENFF